MHHCVVTDNNSFLFFKTEQFFFRAKRFVSFFQTKALCDVDFSSEQGYDEECIFSPNKIPTFCKTTQYKSKGSSSHYYRWVYVKKIDFEVNSYSN